MTRNRKFFLNYTTKIVDLTALWNQPISRAECRITNSWGGPLMKIIITWRGLIARERAELGAGGAVSYFLVGRKRKQNSWKAEPTERSRLHWLTTLSSTAPFQMETEERLKPTDCVPRLWCHSMQSCWALLQKRSNSSTFVYKHRQPHAHGFTSAACNVCSTEGSSDTRRFARSALSKPTLHELTKGLWPCSINIGVVVYYSALTSEHAKLVSGKKMGQRNNGTKGKPTPCNLYETQPHRRSSCILNSSDHDTFSSGNDIPEALHLNPRGN